MRSNKENRIIECSNRLFIESGYYATTMRQIASAAKVSLGLATYHFSTKRNIAVLIMSKYLRYLKERLAEVHSATEAPLAHSAAMVRLCMEFFLSHPCKQFYLECLEQEIYADSIKSLGETSITLIAKAYKVDATSDLLMLFDNYIPTSVERILITEKVKGNFPGIPFDMIPDIVFSLTVERLLEKPEIRRASASGCEIARNALAIIPKDITQTLFSEKSQADN